MVLLQSRGLVIIAAVAALWASSEARADWTGKGEAGLVIANGNTETKNGNAKLELATTVGNWKHGFGLAGVYAQADELTTGQRWEAYEQSDYNFSAKNFWFGAVRYENDHFSGFAYQATASTGLGRHFIDTEHTKFTGTAGVGFKNYETRDTYDPITLALVTEGSRSNQAIFRGTLDYAHDLTATTKVLDKFLVESGANNTFVQNDIALQVKISDVLALAAGYSVRHNTDPPPGFRGTDTLTTINLVYDIK